MTRRGATRTERDRKSGRARQQRWRLRNRVRDEVVKNLTEVLGCPPSEEMVLAGIDAELAASGLTTYEPSEPALGADDTAEALQALAPAAADDDEPAHPPVLSFRQHADATLPADHPARQTLGQLERGLALASVGLEYRIAADRERIYSLLMASAERGDVASLLWLASRLAPAAKQRRAVHLPELKGVDLKSPDGVANAIDAIIAKCAAGELDLADAQTMLDVLQRRQAAAEASARAMAYEQATQALAERGAGAGGLAARLAGIRARLAGGESDDGGGGDGQLVDVTPEPVEA